MGKRSKKGPKTVFDIVKEFDEAFATEVFSLSDDKLKDSLTHISGEDEQIEKAREEDPDLPSLREELKTAGETYSIPLKRNRFKKKLILQILQERGKL
jgi:hypothetical protein